MFRPGKVVDKSFWFVMDHYNGCMWVYDRITEAKWFVGLI